MRIDSYESPEAQRLLQGGIERFTRAEPARRELLVNAVAAGTFALAAVLIALLAPSPRPLSLPALAVIVLLAVAARSVRFPVSHGWTHPTMLAFVPAVFILPTPIVPLVICGAILLCALPRLLRRQVPLRLIPVFVADSWFTIGGVLVLVLTGSTSVSWSDWPIYVVALVAQMALDVTIGLGSSWLAEGVSPRPQLALVAWTYVIDALLAPLGLVIGVVAAGNSGLALIALSPIALLMLFARERRERLDQTQALSTAYRGTALLLGDLIEADDHYTGTHSRDVVDLSMAVADALGLDASARRDVEFAALLHDVGKIHVPKEIINKRGPLDDEEWAIVRTHTVEGEKMLMQVGGTLSNVGRIVRASHEHFDGKGYPDGLVREEIPIEARIVSVCDSYSAMTTTRSYRAALSAADAAAELRRCAGTQFDPEVVEALVGLLALDGSDEATPEPVRRRVFPMVLLSRGARA